MERIIVGILAFLVVGCSPAKKTWDAWACEEGRAFYTRNEAGKAEALIYDELVSNISSSKNDKGTLWQFVTDEAPGHQGNILFLGNSARIWDKNLNTNKTEWSFECKWSKKVHL